MISQTIARRYAQALLAIGLDDGQNAKYGQELAAFAQLASGAGMAAALDNPLYPAEIRRQILSRVLAKAGLSKTMNNFISLLQDKGRFAHLEAINKYFQYLVDEVNNIKRASVVTAKPVKPAILAKVKTAVERMTGKTIILEARQDPAIIGGIVTQVGDLTLDGSVRTQLKNLKESLIKR